MSTKIVWTRAVGSIAIVGVAVALAPLLTVGACGEETTGAPVVTRAPVAKAAVPKSGAPHGAATAQAGNGAVPAAATVAPPAEKFADPERTFQSAKEMLLKRYYNSAVTEEDLYRAAVKGMLEHMDPKMGRWNKLLSPREMDELRTDLKGEVVGVGVGVSFDKETGYADVTNLVAGSPAEREGIAPGDKIVNVNGQLFKGQSLRDVVASIRGPVGQEVSLTILRDDKLLPFTLKRELLAYAPVTHFVVAERIGYVHIRSFSNKTAGAVKGALEELAQQGVRALVLDLRQNSGGGFDDAIATDELFLPAGKGIVRVLKKDEHEELHVAKGTPLLAALPMVVLTDGATSSGAEFTAAALQEGRAAQLIGSRTMGKWSVQFMAELANGYAMKYTVGLLQSPSGRSFDGVGLPPDIEVSMDGKVVDKALSVTDPEKRLAMDVQLRTATSILRARLN